MGYSRRGNYVTVAALGIPVLMGFAAVAIDSMRIQMAQQELGHAADSIAHAALVSLRNGHDQKTTRKVAQKVGRKNHIDNSTAKIRQKDIQFGFWDFESGTWTATSHGYNSVKVDMTRDDKNKDGPIPMMLTPIMGINYVNLTSENASIAAMRTRDTVVVVDTTLSFVEEMNDARKSALTLLTTMHDNYIPGDRIGMATFVGDAKLFTPLRDSYTDYTAIQAQWSGQGYASPPGYTCSATASGDPQYMCTGMEWTLKLGWYLQCYWWGCMPQYGWMRTRDNVTFAMRRGLTWCSARGHASEVGGAVWDYVDYYWGSNNAHWAPEMLHCGAGGSGTNQGAGLEVAIDELLANGTIASVKSIVLISDGAPVTGNPTWRATFGGPNMGPHTVSSFGTHHANVASDHEFNIFSVSFNDATGSQYMIQSNYLRSLTTGFGEFYETPNSSELPSILRRIAENIPIVIVQ